uniref:Pentapeptide repeat-containing protein n=1 Tax=viral metagenome TaxID=1070528 RepID=A0A6M3LNQ1_9ZZZZ
MNQQHYNTLMNGVVAWNSWRAKNPTERPDLRGADLGETDLRGADLRWADLSRADLNGANLGGADLTGADLNGANLTVANLGGADLSRADLSKANLNGANLTVANLRWADLSKANLNGADMSGANLDFSVWPLWCGGYGAIICDRIAEQLMAKAQGQDVSQCSPEVRAKVEVLRAMTDWGRSFQAFRSDAPVGVRVPLSDEAKALVTRLYEEHVK